MACGASAPPIASPPPSAVEEAAPADASTASEPAAPTVPTFATFGELVLDIARRDTLRDLRGERCLLRQSTDGHYQLAGDLAPAVRPPPPAPETLLHADDDYAGLISRFGNIVVNARRPRYFALLSATSLLPTTELVLFAGNAAPRILDARSGQMRDCVSAVQDGNTLLVLSATAETPLTTLAAFAQESGPGHVFALAVAMPDLGGATIDFSLSPHRAECVDVGRRRQKVAATPTLDATRLRAAIDQLRARVPACIANTPSSAEGNLRVQFVVGPHGVSDACVEPSSTAPSELDACVTDLFRTMNLRSEHNLVYEINLIVEPQLVEAQFFCST